MGLVKTPERLSGGELVRRLNRRPVGRTEFRRVCLEIGESPRLRRLEVATLRQRRGDVARTLTCLMKPRVLRNVNYVATERRGRMRPFRIELYLPFAGGTLRTVDTERRKEGLLGSDFAYEDLKLWLYEEGHEYGEPQLKGDLLTVCGRCVSGQNLVRYGARPFRILADPETGFVRGIDYLTAGGDEVVRRYRADRTREISGVLIAGRMRMEDRDRERTSTITLKRCWYDREIDDELFESDARSDSWAYLSEL